MVHLILVLIFNILVPQHKFYLSLTEIQYSEQESSLQIAVKTFTDDIELALTHQNGQTFRFNSNALTDAERKHLAQYLAVHLKIKVNGKIVQANYVGSEMQMDATWSYIEVKNVKKIKTLEVENTILIQEFEDQVNIINFIFQNQTRSFIANKENQVFHYEE